jgi:hypothetical protein
MNDGSERVREVCDVWGPVLERFFAEQSVATSEKAGAPIAGEVLAAADAVEPELRTILEEQQARDGGEVADGSLGDRVSTIVMDADAMRRLDRALVRIRAWSAQD